MSKAKKTKSKDELVKIALDLVEMRGWAALTLADLAEAAGLSLAQLHDVFEDKTDILIALGRVIDRRMLEAVEGAKSEEDSPRDRLFDVLMERFEILNDYRGGVVAVLNGFCFEPKDAVISLPHLARSMSWTLEAAGIETGGWRGALKVAGLTALYLNVLRSWKEDESADLAKTMAALDKDLERAERAVNWLSL